MEKIKELLREFEKNEKEIKRINERAKKEREIQHKEIYKLRDSYDKEIREIVRERDKKVEEMNNEFEKINNKEEEQITELEKPIEEVKKIVRFLIIEKEYKEELAGGYNLEINEDNLERLDYLFDDDFLKIRCIIHENDKPKNKYSLIACGKSIFGRYCKLPNDYGIGLRGNNYLIKDSASIEKLKAYLSKNRNKILKDTIEQYKLVKQEYLEVIGQYSLDDFKQFLTFREFRILDTDQKDKVREGYLLFSKKKELSYADGDFDKMGEFYEQNKEKFNFRILEIAGEKFY